MYMKGEIEIEAPQGLAHDGIQGDLLVLREDRARLRTDAACIHALAPDGCESNGWLYCCGRWHFSRCGNHATRHIC